MPGQGTDRRMLRGLTSALLVAAVAGAVGAGPAPALVVTTLPPSGVSPRTAILAGSIDPGGVETEAFFQWGTTPELGDATGLAQVGDGMFELPFEQTLTGLAPDTGYHVRLVGQQNTTTAGGLTVSFKTPQVPTLTTTDASPADVGWNTAAVGGTVDPQDGDVQVAVEYSRTGVYGVGTSDLTAIETIAAGQGVTPVTARLTRLAPATTHHYRLVAFELGDIAWAGPDRTFTTRAEQTPGAIAEALTADPATLTGAAWLSRPLVLTAAAKFGEPYSGFPLDGPAFAAISTGTADDLLSAPLAGSASSEGGGGAPIGRGPAAQDVSVLQVGVDVPPSATCLSFAFRFLTNELPGPANSFDDAFLAELDASTWTTTDTTLSAPRNFAFGPSRQVVSVNGLADAPTTQANATGTPFGRATPILRASTSVTPGQHTLYLSLFDQGDEIVDSAVIVDRLQFSAPPAGTCDGSVVDDGIPLGTPRPGSGTGGTPPAAAGVAASQTTAAPAPKLGSQALGSATQGTVLVTPPGGTPRRLGADAVIPLGSRVDTRKGRIRITAAADVRGGTVSSEFYGGVFVITQDRRAPVTTVLRLVEDVGLARCPRGKRARSAAGRTKRPGKRLLWGDGKGRFRTTGSYGAATVRGTRWLVQDSCAGTLVRVERGVVEARDFVKKRTVSVRAGGRYLARPRR